MEEKKFKFLVADTTAFINNVQLQDYAEIILTVPDVVNEVKSRRQLRRIVVLPFDLKVQEPNDECLKYITEFAKKTGDYASLSAIDLKVIALTYELEKEHVGTEHLRTEPVVRKVIASKQKPEELVETAPPAGFYNPKTCKINEGKLRENEVQSADEEHREDENKLEENVENVEHLEDSFAQLKCLNGGENDNSKADDEDEDEEEEEYTEYKALSTGNEEDLCNETDNLDILSPAFEENCEDVDNFSSGSSDEDDDSAWITPSNIKDVKKQFAGKAEEESSVTVACMSTDYAIQNVLKQINLNVAALNGRVIKQIRTYILRCYSCFKTTSIMTKMFCQFCGNKTLKRVAVSLDENGQQVVHINLRRPLTRKYKNQSLPRPKGGRHSNNPILVEDQPIPKQMPSRVAKTKTTALDEDYLSGYSPFAVRDVDSKSALLRAKGNVKQWARNNIYEENRRKKNSSRLVK